MVVELSVDEDIRLHHVWCATDAGLVVNPDGVINQLEGGILQSASWVLKEQVRFDNGVTSFDWETYPVLKFSEVPEIEIDLINTKDEVPLGVGEVTAGPTAAAIGNAVSHALGARPDLESFTGWRRWDDTDTRDEAPQGRAHAVEALAQKIAALGPLDGVVRFDALVEQAELAGDHGGGVWVADRMVPHLADPASWRAAATAAGSPLMLRSAVTRWLTTSPATLSADVLAAALDDPRFRTGATTVLGRGEVDEAAEFVIGAMCTEDAWLLDSLFIQDEPNDAPHRLLLHPLPAIASSAAVAFAVGQPHGPQLPETCALLGATLCSTSAPGNDFSVVTIGGFDTPVMWI